MGKPGATKVILNQKHNNMKQHLPDDHELIAKLTKPVLQELRASAGEEYVTGFLQWLQSHHPAAAYQAATLAELSVQYIAWFRREGKTGVYYQG